MLSWSRVALGVLGVLLVADRAIGEEAQPCAFLTYEGACGINGAGQVAYVQNGLANTEVQATVEYRYQISSGAGVTERSLYLKGGERRSVGCTLRGRIRPHPPVPYTYEVTSCRVVGQ